MFCCAEIQWTSFSKVCENPACAVTSTHWLKVKEYHTVTRYSKLQQVMFALSGPKHLQKSFAVVKRKPETARIADSMDVIPIPAAVQLYKIGDTYLQGPATNKSRIEQQKASVVSLYMYVTSASLVLLLLSAAV